MENEKKTGKKHKKLLTVVAVLVAIALLMCAIVFVLYLVGKNTMTDDGSDMTITEDTGTIRYKGQLYRYNSDISTVLLMGVDNYSKSENAGYGSGNQSDVNVLAVLDPKNNKLTLIAMSRDIVCELDVLDENGSHEGTANAQLALAYSYGDGANVSCELTRDAVSRIFYGLKIPAYGSIYMDGICELVDAVGGVTVVPTTTENGFVAGQSTDLYGDSVSSYIRYRDESVDGNNLRMERQKQVMVALVHKALANAKDDPTSALELYRSAQDDVSTNMNASMIVYLAQLAARLDFDGEILSVPGHSQLGKQDHAEFIIDDDEFYEMILDIFYLPVEE